MKTMLLAVAVLAAVPGCGCFRKETTKTTKKPDMHKNAKDHGKKMHKGAAKELMDMRSAY